MKWRISIVLPCLLVSLAACQPQPTQTGAVVSGSSQLVATIASVDPRTREVVLTGPDGHSVEVALGPDVQNFAQLRAGQRVSVTYRQALAAQIAPAGTTAVPQVGVATDRAAPGQLPGGGVAGGIKARVTITAIDLTNNTVAFVGPHGVERVVAVKDPAMQGLLRSLHPGSQVDLLYVEAVTVNVTPI